MSLISPEHSSKLKVLNQKTSALKSAINKNLILWVGRDKAAVAVPKALKGFGLGDLEPFFKDAFQRASKDEASSQSMAKVQLASGPESTLRVILVPTQTLSAFDRDEFVRKNLADLFVQDSDQVEVWSMCLGLSALTGQVLFERLVLLAELSAWLEPNFKSDPQKRPSATLNLLSDGAPKGLVSGCHRSQKLGQAINLVRSLADMPANELNPTKYRKQIEALAKSHKLKVETWDRKKLASLGAGAFLAVVQAEPLSDAAIVKISYTGKGASKNKHKKISVVGKGLCFDTGGHNLKTSHMFGMHRDMTGSAIALALVILCAELDLPLQVDAYLAIAENYLSPTAFKCNEVVKASNGTTIEVVDTDAEGRMVLADTLHLASQEDPDLLIDFATLTGSVMRALDTRRSGVYGRDLKLSQKAVLIGEDCGERLWNFPIEGDYKRELKSDIADIMQCREKPNADHIYAATFLAHFVKKDVPWLHVDLSASSNAGGLGLVATETTGFGVQWALQMIVSHLAIKI